MFHFVLSLFLIFYLNVFVSAQDTIRVLHYTETTGYDHNTRVESAFLFERICDSLTATTPYVWFLDNSNTSEVFDDLASLQNYRVVVWSNTSGASGLTLKQRINYEQYVNGGGNYLGIHAASDTYRHSSCNGNNTGIWDFYAEQMAGCSVQESPNHTSSDHSNTMSHTATHPILNEVPNPWNKTEEYYYWENGYLNSTFTELLNVAATGPNSYDAARMTAHYKEHDWGSRSFYTSLGHAVSNYTSDDNFELLLKNALYWCANSSFTTGINALNNHSLTIYPNPFRNSITVMSNADGKSQLEIYDAFNRKVYSKEVEKEAILDVSHLNNGVYYLVFKTAQNVSSHRIVKH